MATRIHAAPLAGARVTLVTPKPYQTYSGMLPGLVAGHYRPEEIRIDIAALARRAGVELVLDDAVALDAAWRRATLGEGRELEYDLASLNLGSLPNWFGVPGASEFAIPVKPFETFLAAWDALRVDAAKRLLRIGVVGAGAGGVELALAMRFALAAGGAPAEIVLFSDRPVALPDVRFPASAPAGRSADRGDLDGASRGCCPWNASICASIPASFASRPAL